MLYNTFKNVFIYFFLFLILLQNNSIYTVELNSNSNIINYSIEVFLVILFFYSAFKLKNKITKKISYFIFFFIIYMLSFLFLNYLNYKFSINLFFEFAIAPVIFFIYLYSNFNTCNKIFYKLENIILFLAFVSLLFWIALLINIPTNMSTLIGWGGTRYVPGYFGIQYITQYGSIFGMDIIRNTGIYSEAPMYSYVLTIGLLIELFLKPFNKLINKKSLLLIVTIISTTSTTGIVITIFSLFYLIYVKKIRSSKNDKIKNLSYVFIILLILLAYFIIKYIIIEKIGSNPQDLNSSYNIRENDFVACFKTFKNHMLIGNGLNNYNSIIQNMGSWRNSVLNGNTGVSTGFMASLAYGGIMFEMFYILPTFLTLKLSPLTYGFAIFNFLLFVFTIVYTSYIFIFIISYLWLLCIFNFKNYYYN